MPDERPENDDKGGWGRHLSVGLEMLVGVVLGVVVGQWLDRRFGLAPWGTVVGVMLGVAGGMYLLIKQGIAANKDK